MSRLRPAAVYTLVALLGAAAFLYPFWLPGRAATSAAHAVDAPLLAAALALLVLTGVALEVRRGTMNGTTVALLGVLGATAALGRLLDLPGGGSGIFFLVVLAGAAFGAAFGLLLGLCAMAVSALLTAGIGPWLPFQMLALGAMGAGAGGLGRLTGRMSGRVEVATLTAYGWVWGFLYGAILNLWFWPLALGDGPLSWEPGLGVAATAARYWRFYVATSLAWDAAGALVNAVLIATLGTSLLRSMRRFASRLRPVVELNPVSTGTAGART